MTGLLSKPSPAHDVQISATEVKKMPLVNVTESVYVIHGMVSLPTNENKAFINNPGFVVTPSGVVVIDPGSSTGVGEILLDHIKSVTTKPVVAVINTHVHGDHWFGNHAIRKAYPLVPIYAHENAIKRIHDGADQEWLSLFKGMAPVAMAGTEIVRPDQTLVGGETLRLGGEAFNILYPVDHAHTDSDIMIEIPGEQTLFLGDVVMNRRAFGNRPHESSFAGIEEAVRIVLERPNIKHYIPGHGNTGGREMVENFLSLVSTMRSAVTKYYEAGEADFEMRDKVLSELSAYQHWYGFDQLGRTLSFIYLEVENENF
ncbi:MBL fold metallo-hydrolase [Magnetospira sp. QH-2]|uniref:MBL fold metallo-hydrolase n=1 Tax=Magnetospira sp. (strain QH-2) TaxID=1288970 RepID=UPI0011DD649E|nr:MBL fold metallo-hydrolase [Magnetospira sp. QH-2]